MAERRKSYAEQLKDPRWQKKRLEVLDRDGWACQRCYAKDATLHVHHTYYERGLLPWEYPSDSLVTLCETCHVSEQGIMRELHRAIGMIEMYLVRPSQIIGYIEGCAMRYLGNPFRIIDRNYAEGVADAFGLTPEQVLEAASADGTITGPALTKLLPNNE